MNSNQNISGRIHSFESFGTLDGPGIRFVVFMAGCPLRCKYCHNIDIAVCKNAKKYTPEEVLKMILKNKPYFNASGGGVTLSGGDPVFQSDFLVEFLQLCQEENIHTAVDTSLYTTKTVIDKISPFTDLFLISLKHFDDEIHKSLTGVSNKQILKNVKYLSDLKKKIWFRFLVLPGITDTKENLNALIKFAKNTNFELIEILSYHTMGVEKWEKLNLKYELGNIKPPTHEELIKIKDLLEKEKIKVLLNE